MLNNEHQGLRQRLAEKLGWRVMEFNTPWSGHFGGEYKTVNVWYAVVPPGEDKPRHKVFRSVTPEYAWFTAMYYGDEDWAGMRIPDWPNDPGAAIELCLEIAKRSDMELRVSPAKHGIAVSFSPLGLGHIRWSYEAAGTTPAEALSRLALAALEEGENEAGG